MRLLLLLVCAAVAAATAVGAHRLREAAAARRRLARRAGRVVTRHELRDTAALDAAAAQRARSGAARVHTLSAQQAADTAGEGGDGGGVGAGGLASINHVAASSFPLPRTTMPDGFGPKVELQMYHEKGEKGDIFHERLVRCGIEKDDGGNEKFPCNPSFDLRAYVRGLDRVGSGFNVITGEKTTPLFEWSVPAWYKPSYDSARYNYEFKIPEQIVLTSLPSGEAGMVTEVFESYEEYQAKKQFGLEFGLSAVGLTEAFALSASSQRFRSALETNDIAISSQQYKLYELSIKPEIFGNCPYEEPVFTAEEEIVNTMAARPAPSDGIVGTWEAEDVAKWLKSINMQKFVKTFNENRITGPFLLQATVQDLQGLGVTTPLDQHRLQFELELARKIPVDDEEEFDEDSVDGGDGISRSSSSDRLKPSSSTRRVPTIPEGERPEPPAPTFKADGEEETGGLVKKKELGPDSSPEDLNTFVVQNRITGVPVEEMLQAGNSIADVVKALKEAVVAKREEEEKQEEKERQKKKEEDEDEEQQQEDARSSRTQLKSPPKKQRSKTSGLRALIEGITSESSPQKGTRYAYGNPSRFFEQLKVTKEHPAYVRKWILRQGFMDAVMGLPVLKQSQIHRICVDFDDDITVTSKATNVKQEELKAEAASAFEAEVEYRRFIAEWGSHYVRTVVMGGEVQVVSTVAKSAIKKAQSSSLEANVERAVDFQEIANDEDTRTENEVEHTTDESPVTGSGALATTNEEGEPSPVEGASAAHREVERQKTFKAAEGPAKMLGGVLGALGAAGAAGASGAAAPLVAEALKNLKLRLAARYGLSKSSSMVLTGSNSKNEIKYFGGDAQLNPDQVGGDQFKSWKSSIRDDPVPVRKTLVPITELVKVYAGPNAGEQCPANRVVLEVRSRAKFLECMTAKMVREAQILAQISFEIADMEKKFTHMRTELQEATENIEEKGRRFVEHCKIISSLQSKKRRYAHRLYAFSYRTDETELDLSGIGRDCEQELARVTGDASTQLQDNAVVKRDPVTGIKSADKCAICKSIFEQAKCLATSRDCGSDQRHKLVDVQARILGHLKTCDFNPGYITDADARNAPGASPSEVAQWIENDQAFVRKDMPSAWMGWSAILFAKSDVLCRMSSDPLRCHEYVDRELRRHMCKGETDVNMEDRTRLRLMAALDFGVRGKTPEETTSRDACECAQLCDVQLDEKQLEKEATRYVRDERGKLQRRGLIDSFVASLNAESLKKKYKELKFQDSLATCVVHRYLQEPFIPKKPEHSFMSPRSERPWLKNKGDSPKCVLAEAPVSEAVTAEADDAEQAGDGSGKASGTYAPVLKGIFQARVSFPGKCKTGHSCFQDILVERGRSARTVVKSSGPERGLIVYNRAEAEFVSQQSADPDENPSTFKLLGWNQQPFGSGWGPYGLAYAELVRAPDGLLKIIAVQSSVQQDTKSVAEQIADWVKRKTGTTGGGRNVKDPRMVVELEDRDGTDMCMWLYHLCCAVGGEMKRVVGSSDIESKDITCPIGTVCCPKTEDGSAVPWDASTVGMMYTLSHGKLDGSIASDGKHSLGWEDKDPISPLGPSQCVSASTLSHGLGEVAAKKPQKAVAGGDAGAPAPTVACVFACSTKKTTVKRKKLPCHDSDGKTLVVVVRGVQPGKCNAKSGDNLPKHAAQQLCTPDARAGAVDTSGADCAAPGGTVKYMEEMPDAEEEAEVLKQLRATLTSKGSTTIV